MNIWFTADFHLNHARVIRYSKRPFRDVNEMNEALIANWNNRVQPDDVIHFLGDFGFGGPDVLQPQFDRLNGIKHLYIGNHDQSARQIRGWKSIQHYGEIKVDGKFIILSHYAFRTWNKMHRGSWQLFGHSHGSLPDDPNALSIDVGVDCHHYHPIDMSDLHRIMNKKTFKPIDHHGKT